MLSDLKAHLNAKLSCFSLNFRKDLGKFNNQFTVK